MAPINNEHLSPELIAAYLNQAVSVDERQAVERHLLICKDCRVDLAEASELGKERRRVRWMAVAVPAAAAAAVLFAVLGPLRNAPDEPKPALRGPQLEGRTALAVVAPADGATVAPDSLMFLWRGAGTNVHYLFTLTDDNGDVVYTAGIGDTTLMLPRSVGLATNARYFWYVDALLQGARSTTTGVQEFVVTP